MSQPIITSLLDTDIYKYKMQAWIRHYYPDTNARFELINRSSSSFRLADKIDQVELRKQLQHLTTLSLSADEKSFLFNTFQLSPTFNMHDIDFDVYLKDNELHVAAGGAWEDVTMAETFILSIVNELLNRDIGTTTAARTRLNRKHAVLLAIPELKVIDFGTRRRFTKAWHEQLIREMRDVLSGTSNVQLAKEYNLPCIGTMAHEIFMGVAALYDHSHASLRGSQQIVLKQWKEFFSEADCIALPDTWGYRAFLEDWTLEQAAQWNGYRHDSGSATMFTDDIIKWHRARMIPLSNKKIVYSDGLDINEILMLQHQYENTVQPVFGWGTNLTNDTGLSVPSLVVKLTSIAGSSTVKLGDGIGKTQGTDAKLHMYREAFAPVKELFRGSR